MFRRSEHRPIPFLVLVAGTFVFGWVVGLLALFKVWQLVHAPRWMMFSGVGYVVFMLVPAITGFFTGWLSGRLMSRGWGGAPLRMLAAGVCGLVAGLFAL